MEVGAMTPRMRSRHQSDVAQLITTIGNLRWERIVFTLMGEELFVKRLEDNFYLLLEQLAVGFAVLHGRIEGLDLTRVVATADAEDDPAVGENIGHGKIFCQTQRMPHRCNVKAAAKLEPG